MDIRDLIGQLESRARQRSRELRRLADDFPYRSGNAFDYRDRARKMDKLSELLEDLHG